MQVTAKHTGLCTHGGKISLNSCGMKLWMFGDVNFQRHTKITEQKDDFKNFQNQGRVWSMSLSGTTPLHDGEHVAVSSAAILSNGYYQNHILSELYFFFSYLFV